MWLRHFAHKHRTKKYQLFKTRYYEFRPEDCSFLCRNCHTLITVVNLALINTYRERHFGRKHGFKCAQWNWAQANALMLHLRKHFRKWVKTPLPISR